MISNYKFQEDITDALLEQFERNGIRTEETENGGYTLSKGGGTVFFGKKENAESGCVFQTFAKSPIPFSGSMSLAKEIDGIIRRIGGTNSDILEGILPPNKRRLMRMLSALHVICMFTAFGILGYSYLIHGDSKHVFEGTEYGTTISMVVGLGAAIGLFGALGIFLSHKKEKT